MTEIVDLTFSSDSDTETQAGPSKQASQQNAQPARQGLRTPLRKLLALRNGGQATDLAAQPSQQPAPASPEAIEILDSPEPRPRNVPSNPAPSRPHQQQQQKKKSPAAKAQNEFLPSPPSALRRGVRLDVFDDDEYSQKPYEDQEWRPDESEPEAYAPTAPARGRKSKRTREEISREAALKKQRRAAETAANREARDYNSDKNVLKYFTVHLDPELISSEVGLRICALFMETQTLAESERINYKVIPTGLSGLRAVKWIRKVPSLESASGLDPGSVAGASQDPNRDVLTVAGVELVDQEEPHVMLCFEADEFVAAVEKDELKSVFAKIERSCPGARLYIVVNRLEYYLLKKEREDYQRTMQNGGGGGGSRQFPQQPFNRRFIDDFVAKLAIRAPQVAFRDVGTVDEAAGHVLAHTRAIAQRLIDKNDAAKYLVGTARNKGTATIISSLLANNPINNPGTQAFMSALCALPSVGPQIAHALAVKFGSLGNLMEFLYDPSKSDTEKIKEIEHLPRTSNGNAGVRRIGPAAAKQLLQILMNEDADAGVHGD